MANNTIELKIIGDSKQAVTAINTTNQALKNTGKEIKNSQGLFSKLKSNWLSLVGSAYTFKKAFDFSKEYSDFQSASNAMSKQFGVNSDKVIKKLKEISGGTISNKEIVLSANKAMALGVVKNTKGMVKLLEVARVRARAMGISTQQAFSDLTTGIGRMSPMILDNLGIITKGWDAEAKAKGVSFDKQFILNKVLEDGNKILSKTGKLVNNSADNFQSMSAQIDNMKLEIGKQLMPIFSDLISDVISPAIDMFSKLPGSIKKIAVGFTALIPILFAVNSAFGGIGLVITGVVAGAVLLGHVISNYIDKLNSSDLSAESVDKRIIKMKEDTLNLKESLARLTLSDLETSARLSGTTLDKMFEKAKKGIEDYNAQIKKLKNKIGKLRTKTSYTININTNADKEIEIAKKKIAELTMRRNASQDKYKILERQYIAEKGISKVKQMRIENEYSDFVKLKNADTIKSLNSMYDNYINVFKNDTDTLLQIQDDYEKRRVELSKNSTKEIIKNVADMTTSIGGSLNNVLISIKNKDWKGISKNLVSGLGSALNGITGGLSGAIAGGVNVVVDLFDTIFNWNKKKNEDIKKEELRHQKELEVIASQTKDFQIQYLKDVTLEEQQQLIQRLENEKKAGLKALEETQKTELKKWKIKSGFSQFQADDYMRDFQRKSFWERKKATYEKDLKDKLAQQEEERKNKELEYQNKINQAKIKSAQIEKQIRIQELQIEKATKVASIKQVKGNADDILRGQISAMYNKLISLVQSSPIPQFKSGADFTVPAGFNNDTFPMLVSSG